MTPELDPLDRQLIAATQSGLPLVPEPYEALGAMLGVSAQEVQARLAAMHEALPIGLALADHAYLAEDPQGGWPRIVTPGMWGARRAKFDERMRRWYAYPPDHPPPAPAQ